VSKSTIKKNNLYKKLYYCRPSTRPCDIAQLAHVTVLSAWLLWNG